MADTAKFYDILQPLQRRFIASFIASGGSVTKAARWSKVHRDTHYKWLRNDPAYADVLKSSRPIAAQVLADEAIRRGHEGIRKAVWHKGRIVGYETEYSDGLLNTMLKASDPDRFGDKWKGELTGKDGKPLMDLAAARAMLHVVGEDET